MNRKSIYDTNRETIKSLLTSKLLIPMNQRCYEWKEKECKRLFDDLFECYKNTNNRFYMGSIIIFKSILNDDEIWDGQQRLMTIYVILLAIKKHFKDNKKIKRIIEKATESDYEDDTYTDKFKFILKDEDDFLPVPSLKILNPNDEKAFCFAFNDYDKDEVLLKNNNILINLKSVTKILKKYESKEMLSFLKFILNDTDVQIFNVTDADTASKIFDYENNRGVKVGVLDVYKNKILQTIPDKDRINYYLDWLKIIDNARKELTDISGNPEEKIFLIACQLCNKSFTEHSLEKNFSKLEKDNHFSLLKNAEKVIEIYKNVKNNYPLLFNNIKKIRFEWFWYILFPLLYKKKCIKKIIQMIEKWYFRTFFIKLKFNNIFTISELRINVMKIINDNIGPKEVYELLTKSISEGFKTVNISSRKLFIDNMSQFKMKTNPKPRHFLLYYNKNISTNSFSSVDNTLEHILPQKDDKINSNTYLIGNMTLFESKISINGHKGNSSIKAKDYSYKREHYGESCFIMTRNISNNYKIFNNKTALERSIKIMGKIEELTRV